MIFHVPIFLPIEELQQHGNKVWPLKGLVWDYFKLVGEEKVCCKLCVLPAAMTLVYHVRKYVDVKPFIEPPP